MKAGKVRFTCVCVKGPEGTRDPRISLLNMEAERKWPGWRGTECAFMLDGEKKRSAALYIREFTGSLGLQAHLNLQTSVCCAVGHDSLRKANPKLSF